MVERKSREVPGEQRLEDRARLGPLDREQGHRSVPPADRRVGTAVLAQDLLDLVGAARVRNDHERAGQLIAGVEAADEQVVDDIARRLEQERVANLLGSQGRDIRGCTSTEQVRGVRSLDREEAHVGDVEDPDPLPDRAVLGEDAGVVERHLPARERDDVAPVP